ncbi:hypothetical protein AJ79_05362 [Helicocarpus griseus UAMH5409]|uniref:Uncharacterized protein n=1 Tax=Helicocarpus griseus UAMH5409 TaxID=1447875 RepID=A0A2B7XPX0_9EURO|nr:hypothetical protein AJ79_05362 [Helicocarpus griseus UAMH5409]
MSTANQGNTSRTLNVSQMNSTQRSSTSNQAPDNNLVEISHWSPDSSSAAASTAGGAASERQPGSQRSMRATAGPSTVSTPRSPTSTQPSADIIRAERARAAFALGHGGPPAPPEERMAETFRARVIENPTATGQVSSSGHQSRHARGL